MYIYTVLDMVKGTRCSDFLPGRLVGQIDDILWRVIRLCYGKAQIGFLDPSMILLYA